MKKLFSLHSGQTLIETVVAFAVSVTIISAVVIATLYALNNAQASKNQNIATQYAQEAIEVIRQNNLSGEEISGGKQCLDANMQLTNIEAEAVCPAMSDAVPFRRQIIVQDGPTSECGPSAQSQKVTVSVFWSDSKCTSTSSTSDLFCEKVEVVSCLSDVNKVSGP